MQERLSAEMPANLTVSNNTVLVLGAEINTAQTRDTDYNFPALIFGILLIVVIICGNLLVCLSVYREKALKTTTNYFIVSLAVADLMLAVLVLPLFIYVEVSNISQNGMVPQSKPCVLLRLKQCDFMMMIHINNISSSDSINHYNHL